MKPTSKGNISRKGAKAAKKSNSRYRFSVAFLASFARGRFFGSRIRENPPDLRDPRAINEIKIKISGLYLA